MSARRGPDPFEGIVFKTMALAWRPGFDARRTGRVGGDDARRGGIVHRRVRSGPSPAPARPPAWRPRCATTSATVEPKPRRGGAAPRAPFRHPHRFGRRTSRARGRGAPVTAPVEPVTDAPPDESANDKPGARERIARKMYRARLCGGVSHRAERHLRRPLCDWSVRARLLGRIDQATASDLLGRAFGMDAQHARFLVCAMLIETARELRLAHRAVTRGKRNAVVMFYLRDAIRTAAARMERRCRASPPDARGVRALYLGADAPHGRQGRRRGAPRGRCAVTAAVEPVSRADLARVEERIVIAIATAANTIVDAIRQTSAEQNAKREAMADRIMEQGSAFLRAARDDAAPRAVDIGPAAANDTYETALRARPHDPPVAGRRTKAGRDGRSQVPARRPPPRPPARRAGRHLRSEPARRRATRASRAPARPRSRQAGRRETAAAQCPALAPRVQRRRMLPMRSPSTSRASTHAAATGARPRRWASTWPAAGSPSTRSWASTCASCSPCSAVQLRQGVDGCTARSCYRRRPTSRPVSSPQGQR